VPLVLVPVAADHPVNSWLCEQAGVGVSCTTVQPPGEMFPMARPEDLTPDRIAAALTALLATDEATSAARAMAADIAAQPPLPHAVQLVEQLVATGAPVENPFP
jgi:UDP:flavonoid glycosyltransferase YjiC (YdhE family)